MKKENKYSKMKLKEVDKKESINIGSFSSSPKEKIQIKEKSIRNVVVDFSFFYFPSISLKNFNNYFSSKKDYYKIYSVLYHKILPHILSKTYFDLESTTHSHRIIEEDRVSLINSIIDQYIKCYPDFPTPNREQLDEFYQLSSQGGARLIGTRYENTFYLLFLDPYHLIYPDEKFNRGKKKENDIVEFHISEKLQVFDETFLLENKKCLSCEVLNNITLK